MVVNCSKLLQTAVVNGRAFFSPTQHTQHSTLNLQKGHANLKVSHHGFCPLDSWSVVCLHCLCWLLPGCCVGCRHLQPFTLHTVQISALPGKPRLSSPKCWCQCGVGSFYGCALSLTRGTTAALLYPPPGKLGHQCTECWLRGFGLGCLLCCSLSLTRGTTAARGTHSLTPRPTEPRVIRPKCCLNSADIRLRFSSEHAATVRR